MGYKKLLQTGYIVEVFEYQGTPAVLMPKRAHNPRQERRVRKRRPDHVASAAQSFRRLVRGNLSKGAPALLTLTMLDLVDVRIAYKCFTSFGSRVRRIFGEGIAWLAVPEFQARGAVHFHVLIWGLPDNIVKNERNTRYIQNLWSYGYVDLIQTDGDEKLAYYLTKYLSKGMSDDRLIGVKAYSSTRNIMRTVSFNNQAQVDFIQEQMIAVDNVHVFEKTYDTLWLGRCIYRRYKIV